MDLTNTKPFFNQSMENDEMHYRYTGQIREVKLE